VDPVDDLVGGGEAGVDEGLAFGMVAWPLGEAALAQEVLIVEFEFLEAGAGDLSEFEFHFAGSRGGLGALGDILYT
jgi:hypothetical protein